MYEKSRIGEFDAQLDSFRNDAQDARAVSFFCVSVSFFFRFFVVFSLFPPALSKSASASMVRASCGALKVLRAAGRVLHRALQRQIHHMSKTALMRPNFFYFTTTPIFYCSNR